jgi:hypothetical protein
LEFVRNQDHQRVYVTRTSAATLGVFEAEMLDHGLRRSSARSGRIDGLRDPDTLAHTQEHNLDLQRPEGFIGKRA